MIVYFTLYILIAIIAVIYRRRLKEYLQHTYSTTVESAIVEQNDLRTKQQQTYEKLLAKKEKELQLSKQRQKSLQELYKYYDQLYKTIEDNNRQYNLMHANYIHQNRITTLCHYIYLSLKGKEQIVRFFENKSEQLIERITQEYLVRFELTSLLPESNVLSIEL